MSNSGSHDGPHMEILGLPVEWHLKRGICFLSDLPVVLMWVDSTLARLMAGFHEMVGTRRFLLALEKQGRKSVETDWTIIQSAPDLKAGLNAIGKVASVSGWGRTQIVSYDEQEKECRFRVTDSWEGGYQKALGVCWGSGLVAGKLAGYCTKLFDTNCWAEQTAFIAKGDPYDEFLVKPSSRSIEAEINALVASDEATRADMAVALHRLEKEVAERRRVEEELQQKQNRLSSIFRISPLGIGLVKERVIIECNEQLCKMVGYSLEEVIGQSSRKLYLTQEEYEFVGNENYRQLRKYGIATSETRWVRKDGKTIEILLTLTSNSPDNRDEGVMFIAWDITERKQAEVALRESETKFRDLVETSSDWIWAVDAAGRQIYTNGKVRDILGHEPEETIGKPIGGYIHAEDYERIKILFTESAAAKRGWVGIILRWRHRDGNYRWCESNAVPVLDPEGKVIGFRGVDRDITERKHAETERLDLERRLLHAQKLESLGILAGGIAHDFNNLLMAILGNLDIGLLDINLGSSARERIENAIVATRRAADLTHQLLAYSGKAPFVVTRTDLNELVRENAGLFRAAVAKSISIDVDLHPESVLVDADSGQVQQVIMNLITNASEAIGDGNGTITLSTGIGHFSDDDLSHSRLTPKAEAGRFAYVEVIDNGCGMPEDVLHRVFDPFFTTKFTGRGLGMSAVLGIMQGHSGAVIVDSQVGDGTRIRVLFPAEIRVEHGKTATTLEKIMPPENTVVHGKILVVDDEEAIRLLCSAFVNRLGFEPLPAADGEEALALYEEHANDIACVLLDLTMPRLDGVSTFREIRRLWPDAHVILCSGYSEHEARRRFTDEGLEDFIQKPYRLQELKRKIEAMLEGTKWSSPEPM